MALDELPVCQATIWSQRGHCARTIAQALLRLDYPARLLNRLWLVNGPKSLSELTEKLPGLPATIHRPDVPVAPQWEDGLTAPREVKKRLICESWAHLLTLIDGETDVLLVEDDIEVPPHTLRRLQATAYERNAAIVSAWGLTASGAAPFWCATPTTVLPIHGTPDQPIEVACGGTFCCYVRASTFKTLRELDYRPTWEPHDSPHSRGLIGKDCALWLMLYDHGYRLIVDPGVKVNHWVLTGPDKCVVYMGDSRQ